MKKIDIRVKIFFSVWLVYLLFIHVKPESMSGQLVDLAMSIVDNGNIYLRYASHIDASFFSGHYFMGHLPGASFTVIPIYIIFKPFLAGLIGPSRLVATNILSIIFISSVSGALLTGIFYSFVRRFNIDEKRSLLLTFLFAFGTMVFGSSVYFSKDLLATLYVFTAFFILFRARIESKIKWKVFFWVGFLLMAGIVTNPASFCASLVVFVYGIYVGGIRKVPAIIAGALIPAATFFIYSWTAFGSFFAHSYQYRIKTDIGVFVIPRWQNFVHIFFSLKEGFFVYMPVMLFSLWGVVEGVKKKRYLPEIIAVMSIFILTGLVFSGYVSQRNPLKIIASHDTSFVIRYLLSLCPFMMIPSALIIEKVKRGFLCFLGGTSIFFSYLAVQAGLLPYSGGWPPLYALKVFVSSFGMPTLFSEALPNVLDIPVFHTYISRPDVSLMQLLSESNRQLFFKLVTNQLLFLALFMTVVVFVSLIIRQIWRYNSLKVH